MKAPYFVELLSRNGDVLHRYRGDALPLRIGRAYDNDIILDDAHTAPHHAVVEQAEGEEGLVLRDLGSQNGIIFQGQRHHSLPLGGSTIVRLGHTRLRIRSADFPVPEEVTDTTMHAWEGGAPAVAGLALIALFIGVEEALSDTESFQAIRYLLTIASGLGAGLLWSAIWAVTNRLFGGHARLGRHLFILGAGLVVIGGWKVLSTVLAYAWSAEVFTRYGNHVTLLIVCGMVFFHLRTIRPHHPPRRILATCAIFMALGSGLVLMSNLQTTGRLSDELYMSVLMPPSLRQSPDHSVDDFFKQTGDLKRKVDADRARMPSEGEADDEDGD